MSADLVAVEHSLWAAADQLWANTGLSPADFSTPVLGLIFLCYADERFVAKQKELTKKGLKPDDLDPDDYQADGVLYLPDEARFSYLITLAEGDNLGHAINDAMALIETHNDDLKGVLPRSYNKLPNATLVELLRLLAPLELTGDAFGKVYEYFLGKFAMNEGRKGGVFYTPESIVKLIVEIIQPFHGRIFDPACGSGGMFVQSAAFVRRRAKHASSELSIFGVEKSTETVKLAKMNLAVHGLSGKIVEANTFYDDPHESRGRFDFVMANPPFNVSGVDKDRIKGDPRLPLGVPSTDNANYLWIQYFASSLNRNGRAGFVMANSAGDARGTELEIRKQLIQSGVVDVIVSVGSNFFYTVTLPCTLWFFDAAKTRDAKRKDKVLFLDARTIFHQIDRAHRDFTPEQTEYLANIVRLYRGGESESDAGSKAMLQECFPKLRYVDVAGLCKVATVAEIEAQGWSLNPGRYVGVGERPADEFDFAERLAELNEELQTLNTEALALQSEIASNVSDVLGAA
ncbi:MAG TPA: class I SAM-dependent DNA methyltransferase [Rhodanobacteraceae bacterium]|nr:class I SAM-dependent DNA methyltransferase [Rhodanobacteraceae bacterium]